MKKEKAIEILRKHKAKLGDRQTLNDDWIKLAADYLKKFLGEEVEMYKSMSNNMNSSFHSIHFRGNFRDNPRFDRKIAEHGRTIDNAIEYIRNNGVKKVKKTNFLYTMNPVALAAYITAIITTISSGGYWLGYTNAKQEYRVEIKELKLEREKLLLRVDLLSSPETLIIHTEGESGNGDNGKPNEKE